MSTITFYRQKRQDGGIRTGVDWDDEPVLHLFEPAGGLATDDENPILDWYVDVRCTGEDRPHDPEGVRRWLLNHSSDIRANLEDLAGELNAGLDFAEWPLRRPGSVQNGVQIEVVCSSARRIGSRDLGMEISGIAQRWEERIAQLPVLEDKPAEAHG